MAKKKFISYGSDASAGTYECVDCNYELSMQSTKSLPPCPKYDKETHIQNAWRAVSGQGDAADDPYPQDDK